MEQNRDRGRRREDGGGPRGTLTVSWGLLKRSPERGVYLIIDIIRCPGETPTSSVGAGADQHFSSPLISVQGVIPL
jgi:hypothetical protein